MAQSDNQSMLLGIRPTIVNLPISLGRQRPVVLPNAVRVAIHPCSSSISAPIRVDESSPRTKKQVLMSVITVNGEHDLPSHRKDWRLLGNLDNAFDDFFVFQEWQAASSRAYITLKSVQPCISLKRTRAQSTLLTFVMTA